MPEGQLVGHGDSLSRCKYAQEERFSKAERERGLPNPLLSTGLGVRVHHNPLIISPAVWRENRWLLQRGVPGQSSLPSSSLP